MLGLPLVLMRCLLVLLWLLLRLPVRLLPILLLRILLLLLLILLGRRGAVGHSSRARAGQEQVHVGFFATNPFSITMIFAE